MSRLIIINVVGFGILTVILIIAALGGVFGWWWSSEPPTDGMEPLAKLYGYDSNQDKVNP